MHPQYRMFVFSSLYNAILKNQNVFIKYEALILSEVQLKVVSHSSLIKHPFIRIDINKKRKLLLR